MAAEQTTENGLAPELEAIGAKYAEIKRLREEELPKLTRELAQMIVDTRESDDPHVHPTAAARVMGVRTSYAHELAKKLTDGKL